MKKIRFADLSELEVYNVTQSGNTLTVDILDVAAGDMEAVFKDTDRLSVIQLYAETDLMEGYSGFTEMMEYGMKVNQTISTDYSVSDSATDSGFTEIKANIFTVILKRPSEVTKLINQTAQNRADIDYIAMETGVEV